MLIFTKKASLRQGAPRLTFLFPHRIIDKICLSLHDNRLFPPGKRIARLLLNGIKNR